MSEIERLMTAAEVAPLLHCDRSTVHRRAASGELGCFELGRKRLFAARHVEQYLSDHEHVPKPAQRPRAVSRSGRQSTAAMPMRELD